ncbi:MAG: RNA 2',3'-cyclic phosphodiesterase [Promethearchaeia archaeon]
MTIRSFISIDLEDKATKQNIISFQNKLEGIQQGLKPIEPQNLHLTVKFLGNIRESTAPKIYRILESKVNEKLFRGQELTYKVEGTGQFRNYGIIWLRVNGDMEFLQEVKDTIENSLNSQLKIKKDNYRDYKPHLTIARLKKKRIDYDKFDDLKQAVKDKRTYEFGPFTMDKVKLKKSKLTPKGPIYSDLTYD